MAGTVQHAVEDLFSDLVHRAGPARLGNPRNSANYISFLAGFPDPASLPRDDVAEATRIALERDGEWALQYGATHGYERLIEQLLIKLKRDQGIDAGPENILVTNGSSQGLHLICQAFCNVGDVVLSEQPTWSGAVRAFRTAGVEVVPVPLTPEGTDVETLERELRRLAAEGRRPKLFYMIPNFQNPTGVTTTLARRERIVALAREYNLPVVEDDAYSDLRYAGERLPAVYSLDDAGLVMFLGTFSKIMAAGIRLGWVVADPRIINVLAGLKAEGGTSPFAGAVAAEFCASGTLVEHVRELVTLYHARRDAMLASLEQAMPEGVTWTRPEGGFFIWLTLPQGVQATTLAAKARERGIEFLPGTACHFQDGDDTLRLSYSFADEDQIRRGIAILAGLIREEMAAAG